MESDTPTPDHIATVYMNTLSLKSDPASWWAHTEIKRLRAELAAMRQQRDDARRWLRDACAEIARIETRFYDALTPQQIAERNGWNCFCEKEGGGA